MYSWLDYFDNAMAFAKSLAMLKVAPKSSVCIMGFNAPEWFFSAVGGMMYGCVTTGIYINSKKDAV